jgi:hypothetical protein
MHKQEETLPPDTELTRFQKLARALFGVDKREVPKHEPKKRSLPPRTDK